MAHRGENAAEWQNGDELASLDGRDDKEVSSCIPARRDWGGHRERDVEKDSEAESVLSEKEWQADRLPVSAIWWKCRVKTSCSVFVHPGRLSGVNWAIQEIRLEKQGGGHPLKSLKCHAEVY